MWSFIHLSDAPLATTPSGPSTRPDRDHGRAQTSFARRTVWHHMIPNIWTKCFNTNNYLYDYKFVHTHTFSSHTVYGYPAISFYGRSRDRNIIRPTRSFRLLAVSFLLTFYWLLLYYCYPLRPAYPRPRNSNAPKSFSFLCRYCPRFAPRFIVFGRFLLVLMLMLFEISD